MNKNRLKAAIRDIDVAICDEVDISFDQENLDAIRGLLKKWDAGLDKIQNKISERKTGLYWEKIYGRSAVKTKNNHLVNNRKWIY